MSGDFYFFTLHLLTLSVRILGKQQGMVKREEVIALLPKLKPLLRRGGLPFLLPKVHNPRLFLRGDCGITKVSVERRFV